MLGEMTFPHFLFPSENTDIKNDTFFYLTDKLQLKEIVSSLCKKLHHPVALIDYNALMEIEEPEKLESMVEMYPMRRACSVLRKCAGDDYCTLCDRFHAKCMAIDKASIDTKIKENIKWLPSFFYPEYKNDLPHVLEGYNRPVIEYNCPMLGYRELLFPLMYNNTVYGVFFAGQILVHDRGDQEKNNRICKSFFGKNRPDNLFEKFVMEYNALSEEDYKLNGEIIKELIISSDKNARPYDEILGFRHSDKEDKDYFSKNFATDLEYRTFIKTVCDAISDIEKNISIIYENRIRSFFSHEMEDIANQYFEEYKKIHTHNTKNKPELRNEELDSSWKALKVFSDKILQQFKFVDVEKVFLFGDKNINIEDSSKKEIVFSVPSGTARYDGLLDFSLYRIDGINEYLNSLKNPEILKGLSINLPKNNYFLIQCRDIAMLIFVKELDTHLELYESLADAIGKELVRINSIIALCTANLTKEKYLLTLRMYRHENAHISTRLMGNINRYFENDGMRFIRQDDEKRQLICNDMKNTVQLISNIADNIGFVTGAEKATDPLKDTKILDVVDMLYKWQVMFRDELEARNLNIIVYRGGHNSSTIGYILSEYLINRVSVSDKKYGNHVIAPREIIINDRLFELLVYNLVDNAVKYAYPGTNIYLIWTKLEKDYELSVTSFGPYMPEGDNMYGLYVRGIHASSKIGDGLGLYVVKKIAEKLSLYVDHKCERISRYNVPLISWYSKTDFTSVKNYTKIDEQKLNRDNDEYQMFFAINQNDYTKIDESFLTPEFLRRRIEDQTWRTTFRVRISIRKFRSQPRIK